MSSPTNFVDLPTSRHPARRAVSALGAVAVLIATAAPAVAHAEHEALPEGFQARVGDVTDASGQPASPDVDFGIAPDGTRVTATYGGTGELLIFGEQAGEPLLRIAEGQVAVNVASPQAVQAEGAKVDPASAAELIDLVWDRVPPVWEPVGTQDTVSFMDHRSRPGHPPLREDFHTGDVAATWDLLFSIDGVAYTLTGDVVAVATPGSPTDLAVRIGAVLAVLLGAAFTLRRRARMARQGDTSPPSDAAAENDLVGV